VKYNVTGNPDSALGAGVSHYNFTGRETHL